MASQIPSSIPEPSEPRTSNGAQDLVSVCTDTPMDGEGSSEQNGAAQTSPKVEPQPQAVPRRSGNRARVHPFPLTLPFSTKRRKSEAVQHAVHVSASAVQVQDLGPSPSDRHSSVFDMLERRRGPQAPWKQKVRRFLEGPSFTVISIIFTLLVSSMKIYAQYCRRCQGGILAYPGRFSQLYSGLCCRFCTPTSSGPRWPLPKRTPTSWHLRSSPFVLSLPRLPSHQYVGLTTSLSETQGTHDCRTAVVLVACIIFCAAFGRYQSSTRVMALGMLAVHMLIFWPMFRPSLQVLFLDGHLSIFFPPVRYPWLHGRHHARQRRQLQPPRHPRPGSQSRPGWRSVSPHHAGHRVGAAAEVQGPANEDG